MSKKVKRRIEKKRRWCIETKWRRANMVFRLNLNDYSSVQTCVYTARPRVKGTWGLHWRDAPRVSNLWEVSGWDWR